MPYAVPSLLDYAAKYGIDPTGQAPCARGIEAAINEHGDGPIVWPAGTYLLDAPITIRRSVDLRGEGAPNGLSGRLTKLVMMDGVSAGIVFADRNATSIDPRSLGFGSRLSELLVTAQNPSADRGSNTGHGIVVHAPYVTLERVRVTSAGGHGVLIESGDAAPDGADGWRVLDCHLMFCGDAGLFVIGADANIGRCVGGELSFNGRGLVDYGTGNAYLNVYAFGNAVRSYETNDGTSSDFFACFEEPAATTQQSIVGANARVHGGSLEQRVSARRSFTQSANAPPNGWQLAYTGENASDIRHTWVSTLCDDSEQAPSLGWTDKAHSSGVARVVRARAELNTRTHFTWAKSITLPPGRTIYTDAWDYFQLRAIDGFDKPSISFTLRLPPGAMAQGADVGVIGYELAEDANIRGRCTMSVGMINRGPSTLTADLVIRVDHVAPGLPPALGLGSL